MLTLNTVREQESLKMPPEWDEDEELFSDEEESDLGENTTPVPVSAQQKNIDNSSLKPILSNNIKNKNKGGRRIKVKPMPASISQKWPDVVSMLLTTQTGKQVLFVKG